MDPWTLFAIASSIIGGIVTAVGTHKTNQTSREISNQNIQFQQQENEITRLREDNAHVRAAQDLQAAGLSKTLAAGNPASAAALTAPQANYEYKDPMQKAIEKMNLEQTIMDLRSLKADVAKKEAETDSINLSNSIFLDQYYTDKSVKQVNIELAEAQIASYDAQTALTQTIGEYKAQEIMADIDLKLSQIDLNKANSTLVQKQIWKAIRETYNLGKQGELLVQDIIKAQYEVKVMQHNLTYAETYNLPVGTILNGQVGSVGNAVRSIFGQPNNGSGFTFLGGNTNFTNNYMHSLGYEDGQLVPIEEVPFKIVM